MTTFRDITDQLKRLAHGLIIPKEPAGDPSSKENSIRLWTENGEYVGRPSFNRILEEIQGTYINPIRIATALLDYGQAAKVRVERVEAFLNTVLLQWDDFVKELSKMSIGGAL